MAWSVLLHSLLILPLLIHAGGTGNGSGGPEKDGQEQGGQGRDGKFLDKANEGEQEEPKEVTVELIQLPKPKKEEVSDGVKECVGEQWYGGIGIMRSYPDMRLIEIAKGYAADKAGLKLGDRIVLINGARARYQDLDKIRGEPGTTVSITIEREGELIIFDILREKICTDR